jgi:hypothetical protein
VFAGVFVAWPAAGPIGDALPTRPPRNRGEIGTLIELLGPLAALVALSATVPHAPWLARWQAAGPTELRVKEC